MKRPLFIILSIIPFMASPPSASAHAFGKLYNLPVPFWLYLYSSAAVLIVSFLVIGYFLSKHDESSSYRTIKIPVMITQFFAKRWFLFALKCISVLLFFFTLLTGLIGEDNSYFNFNMTFFWIIFSLGLTYLIAIIGNLWAVVNPWKIIIEALEFFRKSELKGLLSYPKTFGYYPALLIYFLFIWIELFWQTTPFSLSVLLLQYTFLTIFCAFLFGKNAWFMHGEFFSVFFRLLSRCALVEYRGKEVYLRPPFVGLLAQKNEHFSLLLFVLFMLSSTAFDGVRETSFFTNLYLQTFSAVPYHLFQTTSLLLSPFFFLVIYLALIFLTKLITRTKTSVTDLALAFTFSLIPIALVYNVAHYYTLLLTQGQDIYRLISDPFGWNWNLFNTTNFTPNIAIIDANVTWHAQVAFILLGHITATYLAHCIALHLFKSRKKALLSQLPMLLLMVIYTIIGLWILSQPITNG